MYYNNPLNIRSGQKWQGLCVPQSQDKFCEFVAVPYCVRAWLKIIITYTKRVNGSLTLRRFISMYAPESENNTEHYINFVCVGRSSDVLCRNFKINDYDAVTLSSPFYLYVICRRMCQMESNYELSPVIFESAYTIVANEMFTKGINIFNHPFC